MSSLTPRTLAAVVATVVLAGLALVPLPAQEQEIEEPTISVDVQVVNVLATVRDKQGRLVNSLTADDFILEEDGERQQIRYFSRQTDLPLTIGLLVDTSVSQRNVIEIERAAAYQFFDALLREKKDLAFLMSFDIDNELLQDLTGSVNLLRRGLNDLEIQGASGGAITPGTVPTNGDPPGTVLYDAVYLASREMLRPQVGRKAVVLITDGNDYGSKVDIDAAIAEAHKSDVVIYSIRYFDRRAYFSAGGFGGGGSGKLKKLSEETGGAMFEVSKKRTLSDIFDEINRELRNQYAIGYSPTKALSVEGFREIKLETRDKKLDVQARKGYYPSAVAQ